MKYIKTTLIIGLIFASLIIRSQVIEKSVQFSTQNIKYASKQGEDRNVYTHLSMNGSMFTDEIGSPKLPVYVLNFIVPPEAKVVSATITNMSTESYPLAYPIFPAQEPASCGLDCDPPAFVSPNSTIYSSNAPWPQENINIEHQGYFDGANNIVQIKIVPFQYLPLSNELTFYTSVTFELLIEQGFDNGIISQRKRIAKNQPMYEEVLSKLVRNPEDILQYTTQPTIIEQIAQNGPLPYYEYVIITKPDFFPAFDDFIEWKKQKGIDIGLVSIDDIANQYNGDEIFPGFEIINEPWSSNQANAGKLRQYLHDAYIEGATWVLLAGDVTVLPARFGTSVNTNSDILDWDIIIEADNYFADFTGNWNFDGDNYFGEPDHDSPDYFQEVYLGRLICSSQEDITNWVTKVIKYEQNPGNGDFTYLTKTFMTQADEFQRDNQAQEVVAHLPYFTHEVWEEIPSYNAPVPTSPKGANVIAELNRTNYGLMATFNHGGSGGGNSGIATANRNINWGVGPQYKLDAEEDRDWPSAVHEDNDGLDNLLNYDHPFIIYSLSCVQNPFHVTKAIGNDSARNFGESFTVNSLSGGAAFLGTTREAIVDLTYQMFSSFGDLISDPGMYYTTHLGIAEATSKTWGFFNHYLAYSHTLIGCPETRIWTETPVYFQAEVSKTYGKHNEPNDLEVNIYNLPIGKSAVVSLYKSNELLLTQLVIGNANNTASAWFDQFDLQTEGDLHVTITAKNYIPYRETLPVYYVVETDQTWTTDITINSDVLVAECAVLTIQSNVRLGSQKKLMISQCSEVIVDAGTITSLVGENWKGIEVWGNSTVSQLTLPGQPNAQGKLVLKNGATLENAVNAVTLWKPGDWNTNGGIVVANDAHFINNRRSAEFRSFQNTHPVTGEPIGNISHFTACNFEVNDDYSIADDPFNCHISMFNVDGIKLTGNSFLNQMTDGGNSGAGIISIDANYSVLAGCNSLVAPCPPADFITNHFEGFAYGIDASATTPKTIYIRQAEFADNGYGIRLNSVHNATIIQNNFVVGFYGKSEQECKTGFGIGIELVQCNNYSVEENEFNPVSGLTATAPIGIRVLNGNNFTVVPNEIYFNHFNGMNRANQADGLNYISSNNHFGLNYRCNQNEENYFDFIVSGGGIAGYQSSQQSPPENTFTVISGTPTNARHFFNDAENHITYFYSQSQPLHVFNVSLTPFYVNPPEPCESNYGGGSSRIGYEGLTTEQKQYFEQQQFESQNTFSSLQNLYESIADGGNTPALLTTVETALPDETWALRAELLGLSPYLSKDVLMAASDKTQVLPEDILFEVLSANPDELKDQELITYLESKDNPLPAWMIDILGSLTDNITYKTTLQSQLAHYGRLETRAAGILLRDMINDSTADPASIHSFMASRQSRAMDMQLVDSYLELGQTSQALSLASMLPQLYNLDGDALTEHGDYMQLKQLQADLHSEGRNIYQLTAAEKLQLDDLVATSSGTAGMQARNILSFVYGYDYCDCPDGVEPELKSGELNTHDLNKTFRRYEPEIEARPNPARNRVIFEYHLTRGEQVGTLVITDTRGREIHRTVLHHGQGEYTWDSRQAEAGVYQYTLETAQGIKSGKLVIVK